MKQVISIMKALGEENRFRIVMMLRERSLCVCEICSVLEISISTVSTHLKQLSHAGLIEGQKDGRWVMYRLAEDEFVPDLLKIVQRRLTDTKQLERDRKLVLKASPEKCSALLRMELERK
ncbi:MAG: winged helix-turn-helix transcriptional regulator [Acidobacteria bacterium]|nr:winged helix-turn-helix transcriptional regulator [Acidobacteriota bacterium]